MVTYRSLADLEDAHDEESTAVRRRLEDAEEHLAYYRSQIDRLEESAYQAVAYHGAADDPEFRSELQRFRDRNEQAVHEADRVIARHQEEYEELRMQHAKERERFIEEHR